MSAVRPGASTNTAMRSVFVYEWPCGWSLAAALSIPVLAVVRLLHRRAVPPQSAGQAVAHFVMGSSALRTLRQLHPDVLFIVHLLRGESCQQVRA